MELTANDFLNVPVREVRLYGKLGATFGRTHRLAVRSAAEAIAALSAMIPGFEKHLVQAAAAKQGYAFLLGRERIGKDDLATVFSGNEALRIAPIPTGNKRGGLFQIVLGAVIIAAAVWSGGTTLAGTFAAGGMTGASAMFGLAMVLGGVSQMLSPMPKAMGAAESPDNGTSYYFNGAVNAVAQGQPFPICYADPGGFAWAGSVVLSQGIFSEDKT